MPVPAEENIQAGVAIRVETGFFLLTLHYRGHNLSPSCHY
jgi:hypothetical protein